MQLIIVTIALFFVMLTREIKAQLNAEDHSSLDSLKTGNNRTIKVETFAHPNWQTVEIDFLSSYYEQDGNNGAVQGGIGTERLTDFTQKIIMSIPLTPKLKLNVDGGYDYYASASTDQINPIGSDDSASDLRAHANFGITRELNPRETLSLRVGGSVEYDYNSIQGGLSYVRTSKDKNTTFSASGQAFIDTWKVIYPIELRDQGTLVPTSARQSYNASLGLTQVLDKKTQVSVQAEAVVMNGLLSTPFHRVYFRNHDAPRIENLPTTRLKFPVGVRLNRYINEWLIARLYYRYYYDTWGMNGHTASLELPVKLSRFLAVIPSYRFHTQTAVDFFRPYKEHSLDQQYYTSDFDLSALSSHAFGLGLSYQPAESIMKLGLGKKGHLRLKSLDLKYSHYERSTGLNANIISFGMGFTIGGGNGE